MPIFEYQCRSCQHRYEEIRLAGDAERAPRCPACGQGEVEKQLSVFATGSGNGAPAAFAGPAPCGSCGDPRGPGSCRLD